MRDMTRSGFNMRDMRIVTCASKFVLGLMKMRVMTHAYVT